MSTKNSQDVIDYISDQLDKLSDQSLTPASANAAANLIGKMMYNVKLKMDYHKMLGKSPNIDFFNDEVGG